MLRTWSSPDSGCLAQCTRVWPSLSKWYSNSYAIHSKVHCGMMSWNAVRSWKDSWNTITLEYAATMASKTPDDGTVRKRMTCRNKRNMHWHWICLSDGTDRWSVAIVGPLVLGHGLSRLAGSTWRSLLSGNRPRRVGTTNQVLLAEFYCNVEKPSFVCRASALVESCHAFGNITQASSLFTNCCEQ